MKIKSIKIDNLFELFDYNISLNDKNVLIITGENGFGKTTILNIISNLFNRKFQFFHKLVFERITVCLDDNISIVIYKEVENDILNVKFIFIQNDDEIETFHYSNKIEKELEMNIQRYLPISKMEGDKWINHRSGRILTNDDIFNEFGDRLLNEIDLNILNIKSEKANEILDSIKVHLIKEQRLFKEIETSNKKYRDDKEQTIMIETIQTHADELKNLITMYSQRSFKITQELDSTYPKRLISDTSEISEDEYNVRFTKLKEKQNKLKIHNLSEIKQEDLGYSKPDSKALSVYLDDLEKKLGVFDDLLIKLVLFTTILNERRFTHKTIQIDREKGFYFKTIKDKELELTQLSSGEQHEIVLLYELIFNTKQNILVLIDEPEISLHVTWQKEFLNDLLRIIEIQKIQVVIATHSPSIINERWDLVCTLE